MRTFYTTPLMTRLAAAAVTLFAGMKEELGRDGGFRQTGFTQIMPPHWVASTEEMVAMHQTAGIGTAIVDPSEYEDRFPWLNPEGVGAVVFERQSGYADPVQTTEAFADAFTRMGGEARFKTPCRGLLRDGDRVTGVLLEAGAIRAGAVVNAGGPWANFWPRASISSCRCVPCASKTPSSRCATPGRCLPRRLPMPSRRPTCGR